MIEYNKYITPVTKNISSIRSVGKETSKKKIKLTKENKNFLKQIGLLK